MLRLFSIAALAAVACALNASAATSPTWVQRQQPVLTPTQPWEYIGVQEPTVVHDKSGWRMWYTGGWGACAIGYATSADGVTWTKYAGNPVIGRGAGGEHGNACHASITIYKGSVYAFFVDDSVTPASMYVATSRDGIHFTTNPNPVLTPGGWATSLANSYVWVENGRWKMLYEAHTTGPHYWAIGLATGNSPFAFRKQSAPLTDLEVSPNGMFGGPMLTKTRGVYTLYYHASPSSTVPTDIYRSTSTDLRHWTKPQLTVGRQTGWETDQVADASVSGSRLYFTAVYHVDYGDDRAREDIGMAEVATG